MIQMAMASRMLKMMMTTCVEHSFKEGASPIPQLYQVRNVHGHFVNLGVVEFLDILECPLVVIGDKVDGNSLTAEPSTTSDPVDVVLPVGGQVVVDDQGDLLHVNATSKQVSGDEDPGRAAAELAHDHVSLLLVHVSVHGGHCEVALVHLLSQPVHLPPGVAEDDGLGDGEGLIEIAQGVQLPLH